MDHLYLRQSPFGNETGELPLGTFYPGNETKDFIKTQARVLVIGAGGLGCEILKDLALSGFTKIDVVDLDTIDVTNLNRQFLFRLKDVGRMKSVVAAEFVMNRIRDITITPHTCPIQDFDEDFFRQFSIVISGLDNIAARRWINARLHEMVQYDDEGNVIPESVIPFIDGGTEGFKGQARVIIPMATSCFECSMELFPPQVVFPLCTVAETPRKPDHCIAYVLFAVNRALSNPEADVIRKEWELKFGADAKLDKDDPSHMGFIFTHAVSRAEKFGIEGVTYGLTMGVVKNIIPGVACTNALIAAACVNEAVKALSWSSHSLNNYYMYIGTLGVNTHTFQYEKRAGCPVCDPQVIQFSVKRYETVERFIEILMADKSLSLSKPSITKPGLSLYIQQPESLRKQTSANLPKKLSDLVQEGETLYVTDPVFVSSVNLQLVVHYVD